MNTKEYLGNTIKTSRKEAKVEQSMLTDYADISPRNFIKPMLGSYCGWILLIEQAQDEFKKEFILQER